MKTPTPEEIKDAIIKFIMSHREQVSDWINQNYEAIVAANARIEQAENERQQFAEKLKSSDLSNFLGSVSELGVLRILEDAIQINNSMIASKPRPKKHPTARGETIAAMRKAREKKQTLKQFLASAEKGLVEGVNIRSMESAEDQGLELRKQRFVVSVRGGKAGISEAVKGGAFENWWAEAGKPAAQN